MVEAQGRTALVPSALGVWAAACPNDELDAVAPLGVCGVAYTPDELDAAAPLVAMLESRCSWGARSLACRGPWDMDLWPPAA